MKSILFTAYVVPELVPVGANRPSFYVLQRQQIHLEHPKLSPDRFRKLQVGFCLSINHRWCFDGANQLSSPVYFQLFLYEIKKWEN